jgi:hypothetical protein
MTRQAPEIGEIHQIFIPNDAGRLWRRKASAQTPVRCASPLMETGGGARLSCLQRHDPYAVRRRRPRLRRTMASPVKVSRGP